MENSPYFSHVPVNAVCKRHFSDFSLHPKKQTSENLFRILILNPFGKWQGSLSQFSLCHSCSRSPLTIGNLENSFEKTRESKLCKVAADVEFQRKGKIIKKCFKYQISMIKQRHGRGITVISSSRNDDFCKSV